MVSIQTYGEVESLISLSSIIAIPAGALTMIATKYSAHTKAENHPEGSYQIFKYLNKKVIAFGIPFFLIALLTTPFIKNFLKIDNFFALSLVWISMIIGFLSSINGGILTGWQKFKETSWIGVISTVIKLISVIIIIKIGFGLGGIMGSFTLSAIAGYFLTIIALGSIRKLKTNEIKKKVDLSSMKKYLLPALLGTISITILSNVDMVLAKNKLDAIASGQYGALTVASKTIFFITGIIASVLFTMSAEENHKKEGSFSTLKNACFLTFLATACATIFYFLFPEFILSIFFGNKYLSVANYLGWSAIMVSLFSFGHLLIQYLLSVHETKAAFSFFILSLVEIILIVTFGKSIYAIIFLVIITQLLTVAVGTYFVFSRRNKLKLIQTYEEINLNNSSNL